MLVLAGRGQVVRFGMEIIRFAVSLLFTCFTHTHFRVFLIHMDFSILYHNFIWPFPVSREFLLNFALMFGCVKKRFYVNPFSLSPHNRVARLNIWSLIQIAQHCCANSHERVKIRLKLCLSGVVYYTKLFIHMFRIIDDLSHTVRRRPSVIYLFCSCEKWKKYGYWQGFLPQPAYRNIF